jgi:hypothetical protein
VTKRALVHFKCEYLHPILFTKHRSCLGALAGTKYQEDVPTIVDVFDKSAKHVFRKVDEPLQIRFTSPSENDASLSIQSGRIIVDG